MRVLNKNYMANDNFLGELKEAYYNYQKKNYSFGKYGIRQDIQQEFLNGKIFVLKGGGTLIWTLSIISSILSVLWGIAIAWGSVGLARGELTAVPVPFLLFMFIFIGIILFVPTIDLFLINRMFLVIGPSGVYYRKTFATGSFRWEDVTILKNEFGTIKTGLKRPNIPSSYIKFKRSNGKNVGFVDLAYRNKEFSSNSKHQMFLTLFQTYYGFTILKRENLLKRKERSEFVDDETGKNHDITVANENDQHTKEQLLTFKNICSLVALIIVQLLMLANTWAFFIALPITITFVTVFTTAEILNRKMKKNLLNPPHKKRPWKQRIKK